MDGCFLSSFNLIGCVADLDELLDLILWEHSSVLPQLRGLLNLMEKMLVIQNYGKQANYNKKSTRSTIPKF